MFRPAPRDAGTDVTSYPAPGRLGPAVSVSAGRVRGMGSTEVLGVDDVDWSRLFHAYGVATDTAGRLRELRSDDEDTFAEALDHLYGAVLHQGTVYPATPPALRVVVGLLRDGAVRDRPGRLSALLGWIDAVGESASWHEDLWAPDAAEPSEAEVAAFYLAMADDDESVWSSELGEHLWSRGVAELPAACGAALTEVGAHLTAGDAAVRLAALDAYARLAALRPDPGGLAAPLARALEAAEGRDERAVVVLGLGGLGGDTTPWLDDADPAVRACAALSADGDRAVAVLVEALQDPGAADEWFERRPARFDMRVHYGLLANLLARDVPLTRILPACLAVIRAAHGALGADLTWGPILLHAFPGVEFTPGVRPDAPRDLDPAQKAVLRELAANDRLWGPTDGNANLARMRVGLPDDRDAVARMAS